MQKFTFVSTLFLTSDIEDDVILAKDLTLLSLRKS